VPQGEAGQPETLVPIRLSNLRSPHLVTGDRFVHRAPPELLQGTVDMLILRTLAWSAMHGYAISRWVTDRSDGALTIEGAALYQGLHRLERRGLVEAQWGASENNRRAKFYSLTAEGRKRLRADTAAWRSYAGAVTRVLAPV
jgi:PadR family transcriptional regulator, regulatory protein PadR